jgi:F-type H+-transporting ATPase subunit alpha
LTQTLPDTLDGSLARAQRTIARIDLVPDAETVGRVERIGDGIALVSGLPDARLGELLRFEGGRMGFALTLDPDAIGAVLLDSGEAIEAGSQVRGTGEVIRVPVGPGLLGRIVDPLGRPLDRDDPIKSEAQMPVERPAPAIIERDLVSEPVQTGILTVDALFAIGRGQRELIIGDRATGKTAIGVDTIINQKHSDMICVYVAVGQRATAVRRVIEAVQQHGAPDRCVFVVASAAASPGLQWIAPFAGFTIAEYFRDHGQHALIVIDDLTKHAATHRELALLTREPPGREAYPGDIFYLHARLLGDPPSCRPTRWGSLTALPYRRNGCRQSLRLHPDQPDSSTSGQIVLDSHLFAANQRPAVDIGLSVSRVGGKAQTAAMRKVSGRVRLDYAQFLELEMFTRFGGLSDNRLKAQITRGERIRNLLNQPRFAALRLVDEVALLAALADGVFDALPVTIMGEVRHHLAAHLDAHAGEIVKAIAGAGELDDAARAALAAAVGDLAKGLAPALSQKWGSDERQA